MIIISKVLLSSHCCCPYLFSLFFFVELVTNACFFLKIGFMSNFLLHSETFTEDDWKLMQLVLTLFRNILAIQEISLQQKAGGSASQFLLLRDRFLELLFHENVMDLILVITQHLGGSCGYLHQDNLLLLEIFHYIFMGQEPELIAKAHLKGFKVGFTSSLFSVFYGNTKSLSSWQKLRKKKGKQTRTGKIR
jgi:hypothetical protein